MRRSARHWRRPRRRSARRCVRSPPAIRAFFIAKPLYRPSAAGGGQAPVALVTSAYLASQLVQTVAADLPAHARFAIADGGQALGASDPPPSSGRQQPVAVANRVWTLSMQDEAGVSYGGTWVVALVGAGLLGLLGVVFVRGARYDRRLRDTAAALTGLADLSRALALAGDLRGVGVGLREQLPGLAGVAESSLWEVGEQGTLAPVEPPTPSSALALTFGGLTLDRSIPLTTTLLAGQPVLVTDAHTLARQAPRALAAAAESGGTRSAAFLPLAVRSRITAILVLGWSQPQRFGANQRATLANVSELADRVLERIDDAARTTAGQAALASLGQALDEATSQAEVVETIFDRARPIVGASYANVALVSADGDTLVLQRRSTLPGDLPGRYATVPMTDHIPLTDSVRSGQAVLVRGPRRADGSLPRTRGGRVGSRLHGPRRAASAGPGRPAHRRRRVRLGPRRAVPARAPGEPHDRGQPGDAGSPSGPLDRRRAAGDASQRARGSAGRGGRGGSHDRAGG